MLQPLRIPNAYCYSALAHDKSLIANAYFFVRESGNVLIDPLPLDDGTRRQIDELGSIATILLLTSERERAASDIAANHGATIAPLRDGEMPAPGMRAVRLADQGSAEVFAISISESRTVLAGNAVIGSPAGALSLPRPGAADQQSAALGLRAILRENLQTLLVGSGQSIFSSAYEALYETLYAAAGADILRVNVDELRFRDERAEHVIQPSQYYCQDAEVGFLIGARKLGYRVSRLDPGQRFCPLHAHAREEELFFVLEGTPSVRTLSGTIRCRKGDFIALPVGETGTHQLLNESAAPVTVLLIGRTEAVEACYYPDSDKLLVDTPTPLANGRDSQLVRGSPQLDYFDSES